MPCLVSCITDSPTAAKVIGVSVRCATALDLDIRFLHVGAISDAGRTRLTQLLRNETGRDPAIDVEIGAGAIADVICGFARRCEGRMIVIGALERERPIRDLVGSTARRVAMRGPCSVMLVSTTAKVVSEWTRYVISVALDEISAEMAQTVIRIAQQQGGHAKVCFAHETTISGQGRVYEESHGFKFPPEPGAMLPPEQRALVEFISTIEPAGVRASGMTLSGRSGHHAARFAGDTNTDLLGVAAPPRALGFLDRFFSHPAVVVMEKLPSSVLIFRRAPRTEPGAEARTERGSC